jgi:hypothetical protein
MDRYCARAAPDTFGGATHLAPSWSANEEIVYVKQTGATLTTGTSLVPGWPTVDKKC